MIDELERGHGLPAADASHRDHASVSPGHGQDNSALEAKATRLHSLSRQRARHFLTPVMADSAMDIMLSLFVGTLQRTPVGEALLATANLLSRDETERFVDRLVQAGLVATLGVQPDGRSVGLTPLGSARMRSFLNDYPDV